MTNNHFHYIICNISTTKNQKHHSPHTMIMFYIHHGIHTPKLPLLTLSPSFFQELECLQERLDDLIASCRDVVGNLTELESEVRCYRCSYRKNPVEIYIYFLPMCSGYTMTCLVFNIFKAMCLRSQFYFALFTGHPD